MHFLECCSPHIWILCFELLPRQTIRRICSFRSFLSSLKNFLRILSELIASYVRSHTAKGVFLHQERVKSNLPVSSFLQSNCKQVIRYRDIEPPMRQMENRVVVFIKECGWSVTQFASMTRPERPFLFAHGISPFCRIFGSFCIATDFRPSTPKRVKMVKGFLWSDDFQRSQPLRPMQTITPERSLIYETVHLPYKLVISRRIWEFGKITVCEPALFFQRAAVPNDALSPDHAVSVIPQSVGSGSAGLSHKAARRMASVILSEPWPQPRFSLLLPYFYIQVCHFNRVDKNQNSRLYSKPNASVIRHKKNIDIRRSKGYTDVATQIYIIPESIGVYFYLGKNACFWLSYL